MTDAPNNLLKRTIACGARRLAWRSAARRGKEMLEVNGEPPVLAGCTCDAILCQEYWYSGGLVETANVAYLCFDGRWFCLYFDCDIVFWRPDDGPPEPYEAPEMHASYPVRDVAEPNGLVGIRLLRYETRPTENGGAEVTFEFENGRAVAFTCANDTTTYRLIV